jgi:hypothetical protein
MTTILRHHPPPFSPPRTTTSPTTPRHEKKTIFQYSSSHLKRCTTYQLWAKQLMVFLVDLPTGSNQARGDQLGTLFALFKGLELSMGKGSSSRSNLLPPVLFHILREFCPNFEKLFVSGDIRKLQILLTNQGKTRENKSDNVNMPRDNEMSVSHLQVELPENGFEPAEEKSDYVNMPRDNEMSVSQVGCQENELEECAPPSFIGEFSPLDFASEFPASPLDFTSDLTVMPVMVCLTLSLTHRIYNE